MDNKENKNTNPNQQPKPEATQAAQSDTGSAVQTESNRKNLWTIAIVIAIVVLVLIGLTRSNQATAPDAADENQEAAEVMLDENGNPINDQAAQDASVISAVAAEPVGELVTTPDMAPVIDGEFTYSFSGIDWVFSSQASGKNQVGFYLHNFKRAADRDPAIFSKPYKFGTFDGACTALDTLGFDGAGTALAFARCTNGDTINEFAVAQDGMQIVMNYRQDTNAFTPVYTINLNEVVR